MVFGVFAARRDSDVELIKSAYDALISRLNDFENVDAVRKQVIAVSSTKSAQSVERLERYFGEVINRMDAEDMDGLRLFLKTACGMEEEPVMAW
jgi:predicted solute-binding protein